MGAGDRKGLMVVLICGTCRTCKHWVPFDEDAIDTALTSAHRFADRKRLGLCRKADGAREYDGGDTETLAIAVDGSDYRADFRTAATFGCVMHEEKGDAR